MHVPGSLWTQAGRAWLAAVELPPAPREIVDDCCGMIDTLATPIRRLERQIRTLAKPDPRVAALLALPGVGWLTAMTLLAEIGDIGGSHRPASCAPGRADAGGAQLATARSATGIAPSRARRGRASVLQEAAQRARTSPPFASVYAQVAHCRGKQLATVAVARRLLARSFHILKQLEAAPESEKVTTGRACVYA